MTWINREAEQELRKALEEAADEWEKSDLPYLSGDRAEELKDRIRYLRNIARTMFLDMHVIDAGDDEAEAALERMGDYARTGWYTTHGNTDLANQEETGKAMNADLATIRARLRAARASHTPEEIGVAWVELDYLAEKHREWCTVTEHCAGCQAVAHLARVLPPRPEPAAKPKEAQG